LARIRLIRRERRCRRTFVSGFLLQDVAPNVPWGHFARLAGVAQHTDGSLLLSDDTNNIVYRIAYGAPIPSAR
jgi:glucose/arabinose dehydrogenase